MNESEKPAPLTRAEVDKLIEEDRVLIQRVKRHCEEAPRVIREAERTERRLRKVIRQLART